MNQEPFFTDPVGVMAVIMMIPVFFLWLERSTRWKIFEFLPAIIWIFLTPIFLSNLGIIPRSSPIYTTFKSFAVPLFIVLMLLDINIRESLRVAWRGAVVLVVGAVGIVVGAVMAFVAFRSGLPADAWSGFGALAGSWIGGTGNLAAVAESLSTPDEFVGVVVVVDNFVYLVYFPIILTSKRWAGWFNRFSRVSQEQIDHITEATQRSRRRRTRSTSRDLLTLLGFGFAAILAANYAGHAGARAAAGADREDLGDAAGDDDRNRAFGDAAQEGAGHRAAVDDLRLHLHDDDRRLGRPVASWAARSGSWSPASSASPSTSSSSCCRRGCSGSTSAWRRWPASPRSAAPPRRRWPPASIARSWCRCRSCWR